jgi:phosphodiesterase/alkaline phosphatase D-like protein
LEVLIVTRLFVAGQKLNQLKYAVMSCSNWGYGYFNAYDAASK